MRDFRGEALEIFCERLAVVLLDVLFGIESQHFLAELLEGIADFLRIGEFVDAAAPSVGDPFAVDDGGIGEIHRQLLEADFFGELVAFGADEIVRRAGGEALALEFFFESVAAPVRFLLE